MKDEIKNVLKEGGKVITFGYHSNTMGANVKRFGVCYFALQTFQTLDKINRQNNSTKPLGCYLSRFTEA